MSNFNNSGLSDPFCTLGWSTRRDLSFRTVVCNETLNPVWNAFFTLLVKIKFTHLYASCFYEFKQIKVMYSSVSAH